MRPHEVGKKTCCHRRFIVDETAEKVECADCGEKLNPIWVINYLAGKESQWRYNGEKYREEMQRLSERSKTKCEHCGHMTRISRSKKR